MSGRSTVPTSSDVTLRCEDESHEIDHGEAERLMTTPVPGGLRWGDLPTVLKAPGTEIRRQDLGGFAVCLIRLGAGTKTDPVFAGLPDDRCQCPHWGHIISGAIRVHYADAVCDYASGESYYWPPGHNLEALTDVEYLEITPSSQYDELMAHAHRAVGAGPTS